MLRALLVVLVLPWAATASPGPGPASARFPNVLVVVLDDWGIDRFDAYQPSSARTPHLDALAAASVRFERAYSDPVCSPTRAAALLGEWGVDTGVTNGFPWVDTEPDTPLLDPALYDTLPEVLSVRGYRTAAIGKWHLTADNGPDPEMHPIAFGFDEHRGPITNFVLSQGWHYENYPYNVATDDGATQVMETTYATTKQVDDALAWIGEQGGHPWFVWLALSAPHAPWTLPPQALVSVDLSTVDTNEERYDAVLEAADTEIHRLLTSIRPGVLADTVVLVLGDNGTPPSAFAGRHPPKKGSVYEGGAHVPLLAWRAGIVPDTEPAVVHAIDLYATILDLAGPAPQDGPSVSFAPVLDGQPFTGRGWAYIARREPLGGPPWITNRAAVVVEGWRLRREGAARSLYAVSLPGKDTLVETPYSPEEQAMFEQLDALMQSVE